MFLFRVWVELLDAFPEDNFHGYAVLSSATTRFLFSLFLLLFFFFDVYVRSSMRVLIHMYIICTYLAFMLFLFVGDVPELLCSFAFAPLLPSPPLGSSSFRPGRENMFKHTDRGAV